MESPPTRWFTVGAGAAALTIQIPGGVSARSSADTEIVHHIDLRTTVIDVMDSVDTSHDPYGKTLNRRLCAQLHDTFADTIGDIEPLALVRPVSVG